jgi:hypothetical protein
VGKLNTDDYEIPELRKAEDPFNFDTNSIDSFKIDINQYNNIHDVNLSDFNKITTIQNGLLNRLKDRINLNLVYKNKLIVIKNNDEPFIYSKKYN